MGETMKYVYKCQTCEQEREVEHSVAECDTHTEFCYMRQKDSILLCEGVMERVIQPSLIIWKGGKPSSL
jgi:hypothetical protein